MQSLLNQINIWTYLRLLKIKYSFETYHTYKTFVRRKLEYASAVWDPYTVILELTLITLKSSKTLFQSFHLGYG